MPEAFPDFNRQITFVTSCSVGESQQIIVPARLDSASCIRSGGMELCRLERCSYNFCENPSSSFTQSKALPM